MANHDQNPNDALSDKIKQIHRQDEEEQAKKKAQILNISYLDLSRFPIDTEALILIDEQTAKKAELAVIQAKNKILTIAFFNPENPDFKIVLDKLKNEGKECVLHIASLSGLNDAWKRYKDAPRAFKLGVSGKIGITPESIAKLQESIKSIADFKSTLSDTKKHDATYLVEIVIAAALSMDASDIHLEPKENGGLIRLRIDGVLHDGAIISPEITKAITERFKLLSGMTLNIHDAAQDGRFTIDFGGVSIEVRSSVIPGPNGENITMRILNPKSINLKLEDMGFRQDILDIFNQEIRRPHGIIVTTGPTGSGKTTTLYAFLKTINSPEIKIITLEDPIEYHLEGITQTQVEIERDYTFVSGLRAIVRQDPDVILVGEIRDDETADIAINAALTGHLVFSTIHTNDAAGTIPRFVELNARQSILSEALNLIIAQRLVRRLCPTCKQPAKIEEKKLAHIKKTIEQLPMALTKDLPKEISDLKIFDAKGCDKCAGTGYKGRIALAECIEVKKYPEMQKLISKSSSHLEIMELAKKEGMVTMYQDAILKLISGITSYAEILSVVGEEN